MTSANLAAALLLGLAGAGHCMGMCGGFAMALRGARGSPRLMPLSYHLGRVVSYALLGGLIGTAAGAIDLAAWTVALRFLAGVLLIAMGLHTLKLWFGIRHLESIGGIVWRRLSPIAQGMMPPRNLAQGALLGGIWGFMPCGLIYSALTWSAATGAGAVDSAVLMALFGIGTLPAMLGTTLLGQQASAFLGNPMVRKSLGVMMIAAGVWTLWLTTSHLDHLLGNHAGHDMGGHDMSGHMEHVSPAEAAQDHDSGANMHHHH